MNNSLCQKLCMFHAEMFIQGPNVFLSQAPLIIHLSGPGLVTFICLYYIVKIVKITHSMVNTVTKNNVNLNFHEACGYMHADAITNILRLL